MSDILGMNGHAAMLLAVAALLALWWVARSPRITHGANVLMNVFCLHCNWQGRVTRGAPKCAKCGSQQVSVLSV